MADETVTKPTNTLEAMEQSVTETQRHLVGTFHKIREDNPDIDMGKAVRIFHVAMIRSLQKADPFESFHAVLGFISALLLPHLTEEEKEALRNDTL